MFLSSYIKKDYKRHNSILKRSGITFFSCCSYKNVYFIEMLKQWYRKCVCIYIFTLATKSWWILNYIFTWNALCWLVSKTKKKKLVLFVFTSILHFKFFRLFFFVRPSFSLSVGLSIINSIFKVVLTSIIGIEYSLVRFVLMFVVFFCEG